MAKNTAMFTVKDKSLYRLYRDYDQFYLSDLRFTNNYGPIFYANYTKNTSNLAGTLQSKFQLKNLTLENHKSRLPIFYFDSTFNIEVANIYVKQVTTGSTVFLFNQIQDVTTGKIIIDGIDNYESKLTPIPSSANNVQNEADGMCITIKNTISLNLWDFSCLRASFENKQRYGVTTIGVCGSLSNSIATVIRNLTCNEASSVTSILPLPPANAALFLIRAIPTNGSASIENSRFIGNNLYQGIVIQKSAFRFRRNNEFRHNAVSFSLLVVSDESNLIVTDADVYDNTGRFADISEGNATINASTFERNQANESTILIASAVISLTLDNIIVKNNTATGYGKIIELQRSTAVINGSLFANNTISRVVLSADNSTITVNNTEFFKNMARASCNNIQLSQATANLTNIIHTGINDTTKTDDTWLALSADFLISKLSNVSIVNLTSTYSRAQYGAISAVSSSNENTISISNSSFSHGFGKYSGALNLESPATVNHTIFINQTVSDGSSSLRSASTKSLTVYNVNITDSLGYALEALEVGNVNLTSVSISNFTNKTEVGGISLLTVINITLNDVNITNMTREQGAAAKIISDISKNTTLNIDKLRATKCTSNIGGALYISKTVTNTINNSYFEENKAMQTYGGAIYYDSEATNSSFTLGDVTFKDNFANISGGATAYNVFPITRVGKVVYQNNSAVYGNKDEYSYAVSFTMVDKMDQYVTDLIKEYRKKIDKNESIATTENATTNRRVLAEGVKISIVSGRTMLPPMVFKLVDSKGNVVKSDNSSVLRVSLSNSLADGKEAKLLEITEFQAYAGYFILYPFTVSFPPGYEFNLIFNVSDLNEKHKKLQDFNSSNHVSEMFLNFKSEPCQIGEYISESDYCIPCQLGFYTEATNRKEECIPCPAEKAYCEGGAAVGPKKDYWRFDKETAEFSECKNEDACLGYWLNDTEIRKTAYCRESLNESFCLTGWCSERYYGNLCAECRDDYARDSEVSATCKRCTKNWWLYTSAILFVLGAVILVMFIVRSAILDEDSYLQKKKKEFEERLKRMATRHARRQTRQVSGSFGSRHSSYVQSPMLDPAKRPSGISGYRSRISRGSTMNVENDLVALMNANSGQITPPKSRLQPTETKDVGGVRREPTTPQEVRKSEPRQPKALQFAANIIEEDPNVLEYSSDKNNDLNDSKVVNNPFTPTNAQAGNNKHSPQSSPQTQHLRPSDFTAQSGNLSQMYANANNSMANLLPEPQEGISHINFSVMTDRKTNFRKDSGNFNYTINRHNTIRKCDVAEGDHIDRVEVSEESDPEEETPIKKDTEDRIKFSNDQGDMEANSASKRDYENSSNLRNAQGTTSMNGLPVNGATAENPVGEVADDNMFVFGDKKYTKEEILDHHSKKINIISIFLKLIINYVQILAIVQTFKFDWPDQLESIFDIHVKLNIAFLEMFSVDCLFKGSFLTDNTEMPVLFAKILFFSVAPLLLSLLGTIVWLVNYFIKRGLSKERKEQLWERCKSRIIVTIIVICFFMHSSLMQSCISSLK